MATSRNLIEAFLENPVYSTSGIVYRAYRVTVVVWDRGWIDIDFGVALSCLAGMPINVCHICLYPSHPLKQNEADKGTNTEGYSLE